MANGDNELVPSPGEDPNALAPGMSWAWGDPETYGAVQASRAMEPAVMSYLKDVTTGQVAVRGLQQQFPDIPYDFSKGFAQNVQDPARAEAATNVALSFAPGMIAGERSLAQPGGLIGMQALDQAERMEAAGWSRNDIFGTTGWFRGPEGKWKYIVSDKDAALDTTRMGSFSVGSKVFNQIKGATDLKLPDVLQHDKLYETYPYLKDVRIYPTTLDQITNGVVGSSALDGRYIRLGPATDDNMMKTLLHEIQHNIQGHEGFARGGSSSEFLLKTHNEETTRLEQEKDSIEADIKDAGFDRYAVQGAYSIGDGWPKEGYPHLRDRVQGIDPNLVARYKGVMDDLSKLRDDRREAFRSYLNLAGEVESRATEAMFHAGDWSKLPEEIGVYDKDRYKAGTNLPYVPYSQQIVLSAQQEAPKVGGWNNSGTVYHNAETNMYHAATPMPKDFDPFDVTRGGGGQ